MEHPLEAKFNISSNSIQSEGEQDFACNMKIRTLRLMVAEKMANHQGNPFLKVKDVQYLTLIAKMKFQTNARFQKEKGQQTQIWIFMSCSTFITCV